MSRLDSFIRRLEAQRACLEAGARLTRAVGGPVLELGLGNGRTYDHLRRILPGREIFVIEREVAADPDSTPDGEHLLIGDVREVLDRWASGRAGRVALVHGDVGTGDAAANAALATAIARRLPGVLCPGAVVVSDQDLAFTGGRPLPLPDGVQAGRYFMYVYAPGDGGDDTPAFNPDRS